MSTDGTLYVVATPLGHLGDLSPRAAEVLRGVEVILCEDTRHTRKLCRHFGIDTALESLHAHNESSRSAGLVTRLENGATIALVSDAGTPAVSDPGRELVDRCHRAGITVVPIPGACAAVAALSASGFPARTFTFAGFLPRKRGPRRAILTKWGQGDATLVLYESPRRLVELLQDIVHSLGGDREVLVARELTKVHEEFVRGRADEVAAVFAERDRVRGECTVLVAGLVVTGSEERGAEEVASNEVIDRLVASLLAAGVPLKQARDIICDAFPRRPRREVYQQLLRARAED